MSDIQQSVLNKASVDKFILALNLPPILKSIDSRLLSNKKYINLDALQYSVEGTVAPAINIQSNSIPFSGQTLEVTSYKRDTFQKTRVKFTIDNRFRNYWVLWKWLDVLNHSTKGISNADNLPSTSIKPTLHDYQTDISIYTLDEFNKPIVEFKYKKAFITALGGMDVDYQHDGQLVCSFEFAFSQFSMDLLSTE